MAENVVQKLFHPITARWFENRFEQPTDAQEAGWPAIAAAKNTLIAAPTGSGKTLAAFLSCIDRLLRRSLDGTLEDHTSILYISPLKALSNDIHRNLDEPLDQLLTLVKGERPEAPGGPNDL